MPYYAQLNALSVVVAVVEAHSQLPSSPSIIEVDGLHSELIGSTYDRDASAAGSAPVFLPPPPAPATRHITKLAFRNRFTRAEKVMLEMSALDNPAATMPQRQQAAALRADLKDQQDATFIDLDRADLRAGVQALETAGLLAAGRALEILDAPVQDIEQYRGG